MRHKVSGWRQQLASIPKDDWKIVVGHGFYYASGSITDGWKWYDNPETINKLTPLFEKYGVDMVFSGHDHQAGTAAKIRRYLCYLRRFRRCCRTPSGNIYLLRASGMPVKTMPLWMLRLMVQMPI